MTTTKTSIHPLVDKISALAAAHGLTFDTRMGAVLYTVAGGTRGEARTGIEHGLTIVDMLKQAEMIYDPDMHPIAYSTRIEASHHRLWKQAKCIGWEKYIRPADLRPHRFTPCIHGPVDKPLDRETAEVVMTAIRMMVSTA